MAAPEPSAPVAPKSVTEARLRADFEAPRGWLWAIAKEITRVEGFGAWQLASTQDMRADRIK